VAKPDGENPLGMLKGDKVRSFIFCHREEEVDKQLVPENVHDDGQSKVEKCKIGLY
jgi:hypothetical protein